MTDDLIGQFRAEFADTSGVMAFTAAAMKGFVAKFLAQSPTSGNPDPRVFIGPGPPEDGDVDAVWRKSVLDDAAEPDGWLQRWLTDAWIALIFARWEKHYRPAFAAAHKVDENSVVCDVMGDMRHLRNDVLHHRGVATKGNTGKCTILTSFQPGDRIVLTSADVKRLQERLTVRVV